MTIIGQVTDLIHDAHVMGSDPLHDYHVAREVRNTMRVKLLSKRFSIIRSALHPYRVMVSIQGNQVRIYRPDTQAEIRI